jgi:exopolyphosphatase/guanosine-5'-triphosphate,3'-diphosphate pyrophosphatase
VPEQGSDEVIAAVDLGSNSFHMIVARDRHGQVEIIDRLREMVRLASGLSISGTLDSSSQERAIACLRRFGQRLRDMQAHQVRVVGTSTLRKARSSEAFLSAAEDALGHPVEVISGIEEARLIYQGVSHRVESSSRSDLVVDIGGGSTELILGHGFEPVRLESLFLGCVEMSQRYFDAGELSLQSFAKARLAVSLELRPVIASFRREGWERAIGSSGTVRAAANIVHALNLADSGVTVDSLEAVIELVIAARRIENLALPGLSPDRAPVFPGGLAILVEILKNFAIEHMTVSDGALREGLLYDMIGRLHHEDARERSIRAMQSKFHTDSEQAQRVEASAALLISAVEADWHLIDARYSQLLHWAARLHEVGLDLSHAKYHQHGAYLLANADMPGFTRLEQQLLAILVGSHRRKLDHLILAELPKEWRTPTFKLIVLLRLAVLLNRARSPQELPQIMLGGGQQQLELRLEDSWLDANPLTYADIVQEQAFLAARGFQLAIGLAQTQLH